MTPYKEAVLAESWRRTLAAIPAMLGRLVYLASLRNPNTGVYAHYGFAQRVGEETADATLLQSHCQCFSEWLAFLEFRAINMGKSYGQGFSIPKYLNGVSILDPYNFAV